MKKLILILAAAAVAASCENNRDCAASLSGNNEIGFSLSPSARTKATALDESSLYGSSNGFGVFAFYQASSFGAPVLFNTRVFSAPNYMYNQRVVSLDEGSSWGYSPVKYWPADAADRLSFFAYAPYKEGKTWNDEGVSTNAAGTHLTVSFPVSDELSTQEDILWADPLLNCSNKDSQGSSLDGECLQFDFRHLTSKVDIEVGLSRGAGACEWTDTNTLIILKNIVFDGLYDSFDYVYPIDGGVLGSGSVRTDRSGTFSMTLYPRAEVDTISSENWKRTGEGGVLGENCYAKYLDLSDDGEQKGHFLFLAPQVFTDETVSITYTVETSPVSGQPDANASKITCTISKKLSDILPSSQFEQGKAYKLCFLLGMDDVNVSSALSSWPDSTSLQAQFPSVDGNLYSISWKGSHAVVSAASTLCAAAGESSLEGVAGTKVTLTAVPTGENYNFEGWYCASSLFSTDNPLSIILSKDTDGKEFVAIFEE